MTLLLGCADLVAYANRSAKKFARSSGFCAHALAHGEQELDAVGAEQSLGAALGALPGRADALQQLSSLRGDLERRAALIDVVRRLRDPPLPQHHLEVSGQGRGIEREQLAQPHAPHRTRNLKVMLRQ